MSEIIDEQEYQEELEQIERRALLEAERLKNYEPLFLQTHPKPLPPTLPIFERREYQWVEFDKEGTSFLEEKGVEAGVNLVATLGGIIFSAIRTAGIYSIAEGMLLATYNIPSGTQSFLSFLTGASVIAVIEGVLAGFGWIRGKQSGQIDTSWTPVVLAGVIGSLAGILPTFELLPEFNGKAGIYLFLIAALTFLSGPGIAYLIYVVTHNLGVLHNAWFVNLTNRIDAWIDEQKEKQVAWNAEQDRREQEVKEESTTLQEWYNEESRLWYAELDNDYRKKGRPSLYQEEKFGVGVAKPKSVITEEDKKQEGEVQARIKEWLEANGISPHTIGIKEGDLYSPKFVAETLGLPAGPTRVALNRLRKVMS